MAYIDIHNQFSFLGRSLYRLAFSAALLSVPILGHSSISCFAEELPRVIDAKGPRPDDRMIAKAVRKLLKTNTFRRENLMISFQSELSITFSSHSIHKSFSF